MSTALAKSGGRAMVAEAQLSAMQEQVIRTVPGAKDAPLPVLLGACVLAHSLNLNIASGEVYIGRFGKTFNDDTKKWEDSYAYGVGVKGTRVLAAREARYQITFRVLADEEVRRLRGDDWHPEDIAVEATCVRYDDAAIATRLGIQYEPRRAVGMWRKQARYNRFDKKWTEDTVPNTWTRQDVAEKRAEVSVLKKAFAFGLRQDVPMLDPAMFDNTTVDGTYIASTGTAELAAAASRMLEDAKRGMTPVPAGGEIDADGYIVSLPEESGRQRGQVSDADAAAELERQAALKATEVPEPTRNSVMDWDSVAFDNIVAAALEGEWTAPQDSHAAKLSAHLRRANEAPISREEYESLSAAWAALIGKGGLLVVLASLCGWGTHAIPSDAARYLAGMASGKLVNARDGLIAYAIRLHHSVSGGDAADIPFE